MTEVPIRFIETPSGSREYRLTSPTTTDLGRLWIHEAQPVFPQAQRLLVTEHGVVLAGLTDFERSWAEGAAAFSPSSERPITRDWIMNTMRKTVNISNNRGGKIKHEWIPDGEIPTKVVEFDPKDLETNIIPPDQEALSKGGVTDKVLSILMKGHFRRGSAQQREPFMDTLRSQIDSRTQENEALQIILPSMPFKSPNPLNTNHSLDKVDLGEYLMMAQMRDLIESVRDVYAPGIKVTLLTDGCLYADLFADGDKKKAMQYEENLRRVRDELGLREKVEIVDATWLTKREPQYEATKDHVRGIIKDLAATDEEFRGEIDVLSRGMFWNMAQPDLCINGTADLADSLDEPENDGLKKDLSDKAMEYATILLTLSHLGLFSRAFPDALRGTIHPKEEPQVPLHLVNSKCNVLPYTGVPVVTAKHLDNGRTIRKSTRILRYHEVLQNHDAQAVYRDGEDEPFYYEI